MDIQLQLNNSVGVLCSAMLFLLAIEVYTNCLTARRVKREWVLVGLCLLSECLVWTADTAWLLRYGTYHRRRLCSRRHPVDPEPAGDCWQTGIIPVALPPDVAPLPALSGSA